MGRGIEIAVMAFLMVGCGRAPDRPVEATEAAATAPPEAPAGPALPAAAVIRTSLGEIEIELFGDRAPLTVGNFAEYARAGHYDGTIFHRVIPGFVVQGGGFTPDLREKPTRPPIRNEASNRLSNRRGTVAMARTPDPHSATAQFFINLADNLALDHRAPTPEGYGYCVFGRVVRGMETVDRMAAVPTGTFGPHEGVPLQPIRIESVQLR